MAGSVVTAIRAFVLAIHVQYNRYGAEAEEVLGYLVLSTLCISQAGDCITSLYGFSFSTLSNIA